MSTVYLIFIVAEWWVHTRPHCSGHQLHYDSDESRIEKGGSPNHPIASCVLYLSESSIGGPTMVTDQTLNQTMGTQAWLVPPKENRLFVFNARYLHGVLPGVGVIPSGDPDARRLTFMVGFWRTVEAKDKGKDCIGAGQTYPLESRDRIQSDSEDKTTNFTWVHELNLRQDWSVHEENSADPKTSTNEVRYIQPLWKNISNENISSKRIPSVDDDYHAFYQGF